MYMLYASVHVCMGSSSDVVNRDYYRAMMIALLFASNDPCLSTLPPPRTASLTPTPNPTPPPTPGHSLRLQDHLLGPKPHHAPRRPAPLWGAARRLGGLHAGEHGGGGEGQGWGGGRGGGGV